MEPETEKKSPLGRWRRRRAELRRRFALTREGRVFVFTTVGVGLAAVNTGNNLLYLVLGLLLSMLLTSGVLSDLVLWGIRVRRLEPPRLFAGTPALFELAIDNHKRKLASISFEIVDVAEGETTSPMAYVLKLPEGQSTTVIVRRTPAKRGPLRFSRVKVRTRYPFGIIEKTRHFELPAEALVFPELVDVVLPPVERAPRGHEEPRRGVGSGVEVVGLRDYREHDAARDIHWRRTAALSRTVVRERAPESDVELSIALDPRIPARTDEALARFELAVSRAASLAVLGTDRGRPVVVNGPDGELARAAGKADLDRVLAMLARLEPVLEPEARGPT